MNLAALNLFLVCLFATTVHAQDSQFFSDTRGNLLLRTAAATALPQILGQPQHRIVAPGESGSFSVVAADTRSLAYQWRFNGVLLGGSATNDAVLLQNVSPSNEGEYRVVLTNPSGSVTSAPARLWIDADADGMGDSWELAHFGNLTNFATADADGDGVSNAREFLDDTHPTNNLSARYRLLVIRDGGSIIKTSDQTSYTNGEAVTLTAVAATDAAFHAWLGDIATRSNPVTLVMTNDKTVYARFTPITFTWTNLTSSDWDVATNWTPNLAPGLNDTAVIASNGNFTVTLNTTADCHDVTLGGTGVNPTLTGAGTLKVRGNLLWASGTMSGSGSTIVEAGGTLNLGNPSLLVLNNRTLENGGTALWTDAGSISMNSGAVITNRAGARFLVQGGGTLQAPNGSSRIDNAGIFRKSAAGTLVVPSSVSFNNSGTVEIQTGTLSLAGGGMNVGTFTIPVPALVEWTGGTFTLNPGAQLNGEGLYRINAGTVAANADVAIGKLDMLGGTLSGTGTVTINSLMNWTNGGMSGGGRTIIPVGATLNAALPSGAGLNARTLENGGTVIWTGAGNLGFVSAVITNRAGALFHAQGGGGLTFVSGPNRFDNAGTFRKSVNPGTLEIVDFSLSGSFNNFGTVEIQTGTLLSQTSFNNRGAVNLANATTIRLTGGGSVTGSFDAPATALVEWTGRSFTVNPGALLNGPGFYRINGTSANVAVNGDVSIQNLEVMNGDSALSALSGTGRLTINNSMNWTGGAMSGAGRTVIAPAATLSLANTNSIGLQRTLENAGTVDWSGHGTIGLLNGAITNRAGAVFEASSAARLAFSGGACRFDNAGTFRKLGATGITTFDAGLPFNNAGTVDLRSGILVANGGYVSSSNAQLNCSLGGTTAGTGFGQLQVAGTVTLNGSLSVDFINGIVPGTTDTFPVLTAGTRNGTFANFYYPSNAVTMQLSNAPSAVILRVTDVLPAKPQPLLLPPELVGSNLSLTWTAVSNGVYRLEFNPNPADPSNWKVVPGDVTAVRNTARKLDVLTTSNRFYRVRVLP